MMQKIICAVDKLNKCPSVKKNLILGMHPPRHCSRLHPFWRSSGPAKNSNAPSEVQGPRWWVEKSLDSAETPPPVLGLERCTSALHRSIIPLKLPTWKVFLKLMDLKGKICPEVQMISGYPDCLCSANQCAWIWSNLQPDRLGKK